MGKDEEELQGLKDRIEKRKLVREQQIAERAIREKKRQEEEKAERIRKEEEEERKKKAEEEKKKKILADRRKQLNVDHLSGEKLQEKAIELHKWLSFLEEDKYDFEVKHDFLKQELKQHRQRVNDLMGAKAKGKINTRK